MSIGSWSPNRTTTDITRSMLERLIATAMSNGLDDLDSALSAEDRGALPALMHQESSDWQEAATDLENSDVLALIRLFTVAENLAGCEAGEKSPVIPLAKLLRQRGEKIDRELLLWIREVSKNRYLPYGPLV